MEGTTTPVEETEAVDTTENTDIDTPESEEETADEETTDAE